MRRAYLALATAGGMLGGLILASPVTSIAHDATAFWNSNHASGVSSIARHPSLNILPEPSRFVQGRLKCARNVNAHLNHLGYRGTGSDMAKSFLAYGQKISGPRVGAIQVERRGRNPNAGHVQIVHSQRSDGVWMCRNPSSRVGSWTINPCVNPRVIAYRMPTVNDMLPNRMYAAAPSHKPFPRTVSAYAPPQGLFGAAMLPPAFQVSAMEYAR